MTAFTRRQGRWGCATCVPAAAFVPILIVFSSIAVLAVPLAGEAQQVPSVPRIGFLTVNSPSDPRVLTYRQVFQESLREQGYVEGQHIAIEFRSAEGQVDRLPAVATELVRLKVDVIVASNSPATQAAKQATETIPIVMVNVGDPVTAGFVTSLAHPGGNVTGLSLMSPELVGKQLELLKEIVPKVSRVALLANPANPSATPLIQHARVAARALKVRLQPLDTRDSREIDRAFGAITAERAGAAIVLVDSVTLEHRARIADYAVRLRLPTVFGASEYAEAGGLLAYGPSLTDQFRRAVIYVDKILKGAKPADLPIAQPTKFELIVNLRTTKALGLTIPQTVLQRADQVIQ